MNWQFNFQTLSLQNTSKDYLELTKKHIFLEVNLKLVSVIMCYSYIGVMVINIFVNTGHRLDLSNHWPRF